MHALQVLEIVEMPGNLAAFGATLAAFRAHTPTRLLLGGLGQTL
jgi:hypothetical protein